VPSAQTGTNMSPHVRKTRYAPAAARIAPTRRTCGRRRVRRPGMRNGLLLVEAPVEPVRRLW